MKKYDNLSFNYLILKNKKLIWLTHYPTQPNPENSGFYSTGPNVVTGGYFIEPNPEYHMWFRFWFWPNTTQSANVHP
jgi:hypothetical protein